MILLLLLFASVLCHAKSSESWHKLSRSGVTIEYQDDTSELAQQLAPEIAKRLKQQPSKPDVEELQVLAKRKDEALKFIATQLGMKKPSAEMVRIFDQMTSAVRVFQSVRECRRFRLWRQDELKQLAKSGHNDPWLTYIPETDSFELGKSLLDWQHEPSIGTIPIVVKDDPTQSAFDQILSQVDLCMNVSGILPSAGVLCHEVAEMGMLDDLNIKSAFRRWFCDGAANYVAASCLERFVGKSAETEYLNTQMPDHYTDLKDQVDLLHWRAAEWEKGTPGHMDDELSAAHYAYSTYEVMGLSQRNGPETIPAIFKEIVKYKDPDNDTILDAIKRVTGESFRTRLTEYGAKSADQFKGLAIKDFHFGMGEQVSEKKWRMTRETLSIPLATDDSHGVLVTSRFAATDTPLQIRFECIAHLRPDHRADTEVCTFGSTKKETLIWASFTFDEDHYLPGDADLKIYLNDKLVKEVKFRLVEIRSTSQHAAQNGGSNLPR